MNTGDIQHELPVNTGTKPVKVIDWVGVKITDKESAAVEERSSKQFKSIVQSSTLTLGHVKAP